MNKTTNPAQSLYQANVDLLMHTSELLQKANKRWLEFGLEAFADNMGNLTSRTDQPHPVHALSSTAMSDQIKKNMDRTQALTQIIVNTQTELFADLQDALMKWQKDAGGAMSGIDGAPFKAMAAEFAKRATAPFAQTKRAESKAG